MKKDISIRECRRCKSIWCSDKMSLDINDELHFIKVVIQYCTNCAEEFAKEIDQPRYRRATPPSRRQS